MKTKYLLILTPPPGTAYFSKRVAQVPHKFVEQYIYDGHAVDAEKLVSPEPFFNPPSLQKIKDSDLSAFIKKSEKQLSDNVVKHAELMEEMQKFESLIEKQKTQRREEMSPYMRSKIDDEISELETTLEKVSAEITDLFPTFLPLRLEILNAKIRLINHELDKFSKSETAQVAKNLADKLIDANVNFVEEFRKATGGMPFFSGRYPFLTPTSIQSLQATFTSVAHSTRDIIDSITKPYKEQLLELYQDAVLRVYRSQN